MARRLDATADDFETRFADLLAERRDTAADVADSVSEILSRIRTEGDRALHDLTHRFDRFDTGQSGLALSSADIAAAEDTLDGEVREALAQAADRIRAFHTRQQPDTLDYVDDTGTRLGQRWRPVDAAGLYVPGGRASYPSSVLMNAIPASVAGVERVVMTVPTPDGVINPAVVTAARLAGVTEIYRVGGAQAVGALAFGTETIRPVDMIVGPGNAYVAEAKRQVFGTVGIDTIAGPSEILVVADGANDPAWIAADLLSQAEHDPVAQSILITDDPAFATAVEAAVEAHLSTLSSEAVARASWDDFGYSIVLPDLRDAAGLINRLAPEHLELAVAQPDDLFADIRNAGAVFLGRHTPEAIGDYVAGPNHVLPTGRAARFSGGLSVYDFMKRTSFVACTSDSLQAIGPAAITLARAEGLPAHALSVALRLEDRE